MKPSSLPEVEVIVHPPVYDPERYNRALEILARSCERAMLRELQKLQAAKEEPQG